ncbi:hypothetical protein JVX90_13890 [Gordonia sp. PDNC005]|uniref:hypothetical protein n=1 Tax=Gordonia sp. PDNC005 TaxID=2811424 RepID=UPI001966ABA9|nr:hypothetical protein [Gordonia sp. PDNC005]QRY61504.1 hypothetical protein JVX90_13890 [Gordonia sp. PDNC005]
MTNHTYRALSDARDYAEALADLTRIDPADRLTNGAAALAAVGYAKHVLEIALNIARQSLDAPGKSFDLLVVGAIDDFLRGALDGADVVASGLAGPNTVSQLHDDSSPCSECGSSSVGDAGGRAGGDARPTTGVGMEPRIEAEVP